MASPKNEWNEITQFNTHSWDAASKWRIPERKYLVKDLFAAKETTCCLSEEGLDTKLFALLSAFRLAQGRSLEPFSISRPASVLVFFSRDDFQSDMETMHLIAKASADDGYPDGSNGNLFIYHPVGEGDSDAYLDTHEGQRALMQSLPPACKLVLIPNLESCLRQGKAASSDASPLESLVEKLNKSGVAVVLFEQGTRKTSIGCALARKSSNIIHFTHDPASPSDIGGGFNIVRKKVSKQDAIPATIQFWHVELDGKLEFGWECRDPADIKTAKQVAVEQRQIQVANLLALDMEQKEIAAVLKVHAATISRDVAKIKTATVSPAPSTALDEEWGGSPTLVLGASTPLRGLKTSASGRRLARGIGNVPVNRNGDESVGPDEAEMIAPARRKPRFNRRRPHGRGIGQVPINRDGDESFDPYVPREDS